MNMKRKPPGGGGARNKAFYAALYSSVGVMLALAVVIGYTNFLSPDPEPENIVETVYPPWGEYAHDPFWPGLDHGVIPIYPPNVYDDMMGYMEGAPVAGNLDQSYLEQIPEGYYGHTGGHTQPDGDYHSHYYDEDELAWRRNRETPEPSTTPEVTPYPAPHPTPQQREDAFRSFDYQTDSMAWPVLGDIVMTYSVNHLIFDKTLEQFRTNDNICIGSQLGAPVKAAAAGAVTEVFTTRERGKTVVVDHGNGWRTTYSQLQDEVLVRVGDVVSQGQQIGSVGSPSLFSSQLGYHLAFTVHRDQETVDPRTVLR